MSYGWNNPDPAIGPKADRVLALFDELDRALADMMTTPGSLTFDSRERSESTTSAHNSFRRARQLFEAYVGRIPAEFRTDPSQQSRT